MSKAKSHPDRRAIRRGSLRADIDEMVATLRAYAVQETIGPLRGLGRYIAYGLAGAAFVSVALLLGAMGVLRLVQAEAAVFADDWSFVPYLIAAVAMLLVLAVLLGRVRHGKAKPGAASPYPPPDADRS